MSLGLQLAIWTIVSGIAIGIGQDMDSYTIFIGGIVSLILSVITLIMRYLEGGLS